MTLKTVKNQKKESFHYGKGKGWVDCFGKASLKGMVCGGGIDAANTASGHVDVMKKAYELGKEL